jgi:hypothetical protein
MPLHPILDRTSGAKAPCFSGALYVAAEAATHKAGLQNDSFSRSPRHYSIFPFGVSIIPFFFSASASFLFFQ